MDLTFVKSLQDFLWGPEVCEKQDLLCGTEVCENSAGFPLWT